MKTIAPGSTDQTISVWCYDADGEPVALTSASAGLTLHYRRDSSGREGTPVAMTPITRAVAGTHEDGAITHKGGGKHEIDMPDLACIAGVESVTVVLTATGVTDVIAEKALLQLTPAAALTAYDAATGADVSGAAAPSVADIAEELALRHGQGSWEGGSQAYTSRGSSNPAAGFAVRSGHTERIQATIVVNPSFPNRKITIVIPNAIRRELDTATATQAGLSIMANDLVWNLPVRELKGLTVRTGTVLTSADGARHQVVGFGTGVTGKVGVFGEEVRPVTRLEV